MNYCCHCGAGVSLRIPAGDNLPRYVCDRCGAIHYQNPRMVVGCIPVWRERVLLCRRAIEPRQNYWTLPAGFLENGESTVQGAVRETLEEANAQVEELDLFTVYSLPHISQVHLMYRASLLEPSFSPTAESLEVALFAETEIPWQELAFTTIKETLKHFFADRRSGAFSLHTGDLGPLREQNKR